MLIRFELIDFQYEHHHDFDESTADKDAWSRDWKLMSSIDDFLIKTDWNFEVCSMYDESVKTDKNHEGLCTSQ